MHSIQQYGKLFTILIVTLFVIFGVITPASAQTRTVSFDQIPPVNVVTETDTQLRSLGCETANVQQYSLQIPTDKPNVIQSQTNDKNSYFFCSDQTLSQLTVKGQVAGWFDDIGCISGLAGGVNPLTSLSTLYSCYNSELASEVGRVTGEWALTKVLQILQGIVLVFNQIGIFLLGLVISLLNYALSPTQFATHGIVTTGWPFVQGIANLGFIVALLAIAFGTTLQIQDFSARRMLPRLLFAAILINFSLLIGTLIVDASRLIMAIEVNVLGGGGAGVVNVGNLIIQKSRLIHLFAYLTANGTGLGDLLATGEAINDGWTPLAKLLIATVLVWGSLIGFAVTAIMLVVRYVAILLLLTISPLAFLAIALPRADGLARKWWSEFIKYVLYGPAVLFMLMLTVKALDTQAFFGRVIVGQLATDLLTPLVFVSAMIIMLYMTATASRYLGLFGAAATVNFVSGKAKQAARLYGGGIGAGIGAAARLGERSLSKTPIANTPAGKAAASIYRGTKKVAGVGTKSIFGKEGENFVKATGLGAKGAGATADFLEKRIKQTPINKEAADLARQVRTGGIAANMANIQAFAKKGGLRNEEAVKILAGEKGKNILDFAKITPDAQNIRDIASNKELIKEHGDGFAAELQQNIQNNANITLPTQKQKVTRRDASGNIIGTDDIEVSKTEDFKADMTKLVHDTVVRVGNDKEKGKGK